MLYVMYFVLKGLVMFAIIPWVEPSQVGQVAIVGCLSFVAAMFMAALHHLFREVL